MNNTIIRLAVSTAGSLRILYAHMLPLFRRERAYTREQMTASMKGIKKKFCFSQSTVVRSSPASFISRRCERDLVSLPVLACVHARLPILTCRQSDTFHLEIVHAHSQRDTIVRTRKVRFVRRLDWRAYLANQHSDCRDYVQLRFSRYNRRQYAP